MCNELNEFGHDDSAKNGWEGRAKIIIILLAYTTSISFAKKKKRKLTLYKDARRRIKLKHARGIPGVEKKVLF